MLQHATGPLAAHTIANALEVSMRTIYRDITTLQAMGVPIDGGAGVGYVMQAVVDLPPVIFTADEVEAIVVGLSLIGRTGDAALWAAAVRVSRKIAGVIPNTNGCSVERLPLLVSHWNAIPPPAVE